MVFGGRALREHRRSTASIPLLVWTILCPMPRRPKLSFAESLTSEQRQIFYEGHRFLAMLMILIVLLFPFAGLYVTGLLGAVLGIVLSVAGYYLIPYVWLTVFR